MTDLSMKLVLFTYRGVRSKQAATYRPTGVEAFSDAELARWAAADKDPRSAGFEQNTKDPRAKKVKPAKSTPGAPGGYTAQSPKGTTAAAAGGKAKAEAELARQMDAYNKKQEAKTYSDRGVKPKQTGPMRLNPATGKMVPVSAAEAAFSNMAVLSPAAVDERWYKNEPPKPKVVPTYAQSSGMKTSPEVNKQFQSLSTKAKPGVAPKKVGGRFGSLATALAAMGTVGAGMALAPKKNAWADTLSLGQ